MRSPEEIACWELAKRTFGKPEHKPNEGCYAEFSEDGALVKHVTRTSWGIGTNFINSCDGCSEPQWEEPMLTCHECGGSEFCAECWIEHEKRHDNGQI